MFKVRGTLQASSRNRVHSEASPGLQWFIHSLVLWCRDTYLTSLSLSFLISKIEVNVCHLSGDRGSHAHMCTGAHTGGLAPRLLLDPGSIWCGSAEQGLCPRLRLPSEPAGPAAGNGFLPLLRDHFSGSAGTVSWLAVWIPWPSVSITFSLRGQHCWPSRGKLFWDQRWRWFLVAPWWQLLSTFCLTP